MTRIETVEYGPVATDQERIDAFAREMEGAKRLASAVFHSAPDGAAGYRSIHLMRLLISLEAVVAEARELTRCARPKRERSIPKSAVYRCRKCAGCRLAISLKCLDDSELHRAEFDARVAAEPADPEGGAA